jgi:hypothetical protein
MAIRQRLAANNLYSGCAVLAERVVIRAFAPVVAP